MNFFESQDTAKRNTTRLIVLFALAVLSLIVITNFLVLLIFGFAGTELTSVSVNEPREFDLEMFLSVGAGVAAIVLIGSLYKIGSLSGGGASVAEMMNGRLLPPGSGDTDERRVLNVVEEMAIASGTPVPPVYLMEEEGINAFAAGYSPSDAVIGITRGAITTLSREQLQGVIAHEFSHILHGDMRINIRLIGVLHGILVLGIIGHHLLRGGAHGRRSKGSGGIVALGLGLIVIGFVGTFFGNLIKAAVSRQREFLADAAAVQFTRNPNGIAGALMQIQQHSNRSYLANPSSEEISHSLFEEARASHLTRLYATHPPLEARIGAILPNWDGSYDMVAPPKVRVEPVESAEKTESPSRADAFLSATAGVLIADAIMNQTGNPDARHLQHADKLLQGLPDGHNDAARDPSGARAIVYGMVLSKDEQVRQEQLALLQENADPGVYSELSRLLATGEALSPDQRIPVIEIALASLRQLSKKQFGLFRNNFNRLIALDKKINLLEWALQRIVFHHLDIVFGISKKPGLGRRELRQSGKAVALLLSVLVRACRQQGISEEEAFAEGAEVLEMKLQLLPASAINFKALNKALDNLAQLKPLQKPVFLKACAACITADQSIAAIETELLRAVAASIDCPMPPLVSE